MELELTQIPFGATEVARLWFAYAAAQVDWLKVHLMIGVKTNVVTSIEISARHAHDAPFSPALVEGTALNFELESVAADKAYSSRKNLEVVAKRGAVPNIPFKTNALEPREDSIWKKMYHLYHFNRDAFLAHYQEVQCRIDFCDD